MVTVLLIAITLFGTADVEDRGSVSRPHDPDQLCFPVGQTGPVPWVVFSHAFGLESVPR
jgi:hypothetical protein